MPVLYPVRLFAVIALFLLTAAALSGQQSATGTVVGEDGLPLIGVSILVANSSSGTITDADGRYSLSTAPGAELVFSYTGYTTQRLSVPPSGALDVTLQSGALLDEVVVTALGITREKKALGYSVDELQADEITQLRQPNIVNAMQGQAAGVQVSSAGGGPGQAARIIIRGVNSIDPSADNQPLFVIDGIPISNETLTVGGGGSRNVSNRVADINPNDIETLTILKGGAATALYGLRASTGAVVITTKRGKAGKVSIDYSSSYGSETVNKFPDVQKTYTQGFGGAYDADSFWPSWGPTVAEARNQDPNHPAELFNNYENAFGRGEQWRNTVSVSGGDEKAQFRTSLSHLTHDGVLPFSTYENTSFLINADYRASEKFSFGGGMNYIRSGGNRVDADRFNTRLTYWAPQSDVNDFIQPDGSMNGYRFNGAGGNNPIYGEATNKFVDDVDRYIGNLKFTYSPTDYLTFNYLLGLDQYTDFRRNTGQGPVFVGAPNFEDNGLGFVEETSIRRRDLTSNINGILTKDVTPDFGVRFLAGFDVFDSNYNRTSVRGSELDIFDLYTLGNASVFTRSTNVTERRLLGLYGDLSFEFRKAVYLSITGRNDWTSTLPKDSRSFFYPSVSLGVVLSDLTELPEALSFVKFRASYAGIGKDTEPYRTNTIYATNNPINEGTLWTRGNQQGSPDLTPERTNTFEVGVDLRFLDNRIGVDFTWYNATSIDQILAVPVSNATGFTTFVLNAGSLRNRGVEMRLTATPVRTEKFSWDVSANFTRNRNEVLDIFEGLDEIPISSSFGYAGSSASIRLVPGLPYGNIYGTSYARFNPDLNPDPDEDPSLFIDESQPRLIGDDGFPVRETNQKILGNAQPQWFGAFNSTIRYERFSFSFMLDTRRGVQKYNQQGNFFSAFGISPETLNRNETIVFEGVTADGQPNTKEVFLGQGVGPDGEDYGVGYYRNVFRGVTENFIEDADWIRLRNVSLSYDLPASLFANNFLTGANVTFTGNNLWLSTPFSGYDPEGNQGNQNGDDGFGGFTYPNVRSYFVTLNVKL
ncbi:SusC/RagA family TonB-linked outer membrane protein [Neolewinella antarctica]|uniref:TonB-linked SusC/RagA family outer membrane protein n=1 Tax=Neolewinella antarctica TaxID=442734 RepID=A0ABX0XAP5_9BACT|nr:SusC/RagA family TonB-linked outer membrane protein [Neolewinella antarctica]NJC26031.1 TonB-linked SusC/RagA family outer membrane protein [Neolewinella antarctica]